MFSELTLLELETLEYLMISARRTMYQTPQETWPYAQRDPWDDVTDTLIDVMEELRERGIPTWWPKI